MQCINVQTNRRCDMIDVTNRIQQIVGDAGIKTGYVICYVPHTTAGITIQENADPDVVHDLLWKLERLIPKDDSGFLHNEGNSPHQSLAHRPVANHTHRGRPAGPGHLAGNLLLRIRRPANAKTTDQMCE
jgi:thiamine phosphate synthase YjbQ (UPF0047 family)